MFNLRLRIIHLFKDWKTNHFPCVLVISSLTRWETVYAILNLTNQKLKQFFQMLN